MEAVARATRRAIDSSVSLGAPRQRPVRSGALFAAAGAPTGDAFRLDRPLVKNAGTLVQLAAKQTTDSDSCGRALVGYY